MNRDREIYQQANRFFLLGIALIGVALFAPDAAKGPMSFLRYARHSTWGHWLDLAAAWCSIKIILLSIGLFLVIESIASVLLVRRLKILAWPMFFLHLLPGVGLLCGFYYLVKSLL